MYCGVCRCNSSLLNLPFNETHAHVCSGKKGYICMVDKCVGIQNVVYSNCTICSRFF